MMITTMAWRNIWRNKTRSIVITISVALGLFAGLSILAIYKGMMKARVRTVIDSETGHLQIHDKKFKEDYDARFIIKNGNEIQRSIIFIDKVKFVSARTLSYGMLATPRGNNAVQINGIIPENEYAVSGLKNKLIAGDVFDASKKNQIMIGQKLAKKMKLDVKSKLVLTFTDTAENLVSAAFRVCGIYKSDNAPLDEKMVYVHSKDFNPLLLTQNNFHELTILLKHDEDVVAVKEELQKKYPALLIESWREISPETDLLVRTVDRYSYIIIVIILIALSFGIANTMLMSILERTKEMGMMMALGTSPRRMFFLIIQETVFLSIIGIPVGGGIAWLLINYFNQKGLDLSGMGKEMMGSFGFSTIIYPEFPTEKIFTISIIVLITAVLSGILPAAKAIRLHPAAALTK